MNYKKGFTLIELLVVIAIIGILASIVLASLNSARIKSRDARRIADIKQIQLALELYFDSSASYPPGTDLTPVKTGNFIPVVPIDPLNSGTHVYRYQALTSITTKTACTSGCLAYSLAAVLEETSSPALTSDADISFGTFVGAGASCVTGGTEDCYDVTP
ncbi:MAG: type II secretion system protein [Candidatus Colwellbacteria bacterium]|nr:type II secretion system protein [Candidatus Colwellbacteria bacterium]